jgi:ADP-heptose:LPS heptosyltransferase
MAQTWPVSRTRRGALRIVDLVGKAVFGPFRRRRGKLEPAEIHRILVIEPWNIGDIVLATPVLAELRARFPRARISLLAKLYATELLDGSGLADEVIVCDLPWTAQKNKYRFTLRVLNEMRDLVVALRARRFDVVLDARMDIRANVLAALSGARHRVGYDIGGGGWLLTETLPGNRNETHKIDDWLALLSLIGSDTSSSARGSLATKQPTLFVSEAERVAARTRLDAMTDGPGPTIGYHPGGSHPGKRWPRQHFEGLAKELSRTIGGRHVIFLGPEDATSRGWSKDVATVRPSLRELMAMMTQCDVIVCNDSGPMHIADALRVPVVAIFEVGNPKWFGPSGSRATVVAGELTGTGISAAPLDRPPANPVPVARVASAVREALSSTR